MGKIVETTINRFDGGIESDPRDPRENTCQLVSNFDIISNPRKMTPYRSSEDGDSSAGTNRIQNFVIALQTGTTYRLFGLGRNTSDRAVVFNKELNTTGTDNLANATWGQNSNNATTAGTMTSPRDFRLFIYYRRTGYLYGAINADSIWRIDPDGGDAVANQTQALTYTDIFQGLVHPKDNILYIPYYNNAGGANAKSFIASFDGTTWNNTALTLPDHLMPFSISEYGNFIAIGCTPASGIGNSIVYLWDRDATLTTLSESVDWGDGRLRVLQEVDGELIGISLTSAVGLNPVPDINFQDRVIFRRLVGNRAVKFKELLANHSGAANTSRIELAKQRVDNRLYFMMLIELNGSVRSGIWSVGRSSPSEPFTLIHERTSNNDTALATADIPHNFFAAGNYLFNVYETSGGTWNLRKTNDASTFAHYSVYESKRFATGDASLTKDLIGITVMHEYLPASASVEVAYRIDEQTAWTLILTSDTDDDIFRSAINIESSGAALPKDYNEIEFRVRTTGGNAEVTALSFMEEITGKRPYGHA